MMEWLALLLFAAVVLVLMAGYPVAFTLAGVSLVFATAGVIVGAFDMAYLNALPNRLFGIMSNETLIAVPLFVFMGVMLEKTRLAEDLLSTMAQVFGGLRGGLGLSVVMVGMLLAASTGIVGATVIAMGLLALPTMLRHGYRPSVACGTICAAGTLGQIIPPSIILVLLGDIISTAYQQAQLRQGIFAPDTVSVSDLFTGAVIPGVMLVLLYVIYLLVTAWLRPQVMPPLAEAARASGIGELLPRLFKAVLPPLLLMVAVLGSIMAGLATPTEAASVGAGGALLLALVNRQLSLARLREVMQHTVRITSMVFMIFIGAALFSLVFRGYGGDDLVHDVLSDMPGGVVGAMLLSMLVMFLLGFVLDFIEITFVVVPIVAPVLLALGVDPVWLGIMIAINLQTSFLTPPFGFALFYLRGVAPDGVTTRDIYRGVAPFIAIQLAMLGLLALWPALATWLPAVLNPTP